MKAIDILGLPLKSHEVIDLLEAWEVDVTYDFDRCFENMPDTYWASSKENGILLRFDTEQRLSTIYAYQKKIEGYEPSDPDFIGVTIFASIDAVKAYGEKNGITISEGGGTFFGNELEWIRLDKEEMQTRYEFRQNELVEVTLNKPETDASGQRR